MQSTTVYYINEIMLHMWHTKWWIEFQIFPLLQQLIYLQYINVVLIISSFNDIDSRYQRAEKWNE